MLGLSLERSENEPFNMQTIIYERLAKLDQSGRSTVPSLGHMLRMRDVGAVHELPGACEPFVWPAGMLDQALPKDQSSGTETLQWDGIVEAEKHLIEPLLPWR
jgi:hypothetical protein